MKTDEQKRAILAVFDGCASTADTRAALAALEALTAERDAYRDFAVKIGEVFGPPDADNLIERHLAPGDLVHLAEYVGQQLAAGRDERAALRARIAGALVIEVNRATRGRWVAVAPAYGESRVGVGDNRQDAVAALVALLPCVEIREVE